MTIHIHYTAEGMPCHVTVEEAFSARRILEAIKRGEDYSLTKIRITGHGGQDLEVTAADLGVQGLDNPYRKNLMPPGD